MRQVDQTYPLTAERIRAHVETLRGEDVQESLDQLADIIYYTWPGPGYEMPEVSPETLPDWDEYLLDELTGNRRVLKLIDDLQAVPPKEASELLRSRLSEALPRYVALYEAEWESIRAQAERQERSGQPGVIGYFVGGTSPSDIRLPGARHEVLALVFLAGQLELHDAAPMVHQVVTRALDERARLSREDPRIAPTHRVMGSVYSPLVLGNALVRTAPGASPADTAFAVAHRLELTKYDASLTTNDKPVTFGAPADFSKGKIEVRYRDVRSDAAFDALVNAYVTAQ